MKNEFFEIRLGFISNVEKYGWDKAVMDFKKKFNISEATAKKWWKWYEEEICIPLVQHETDSGPEEIKSQKGTGVKIEDLPLIIIGKQNVCFMGKTYRIESEGLYRFSVITRSVRNLIMIQDNNSMIPVLKSLALMQIHGNRDSSFSSEEWKKLLLSRYWISLTCGHIASLTGQVLSDYGFKSRIVSAFTFSDWNTYNNGHMLLEVFFPSILKWVLVDIDMGYVFLDDNGFIDAISFWRCVKQKKQPVFVPLATKEIDPLWLENNFSYAHMWRNIVKDIPSKWSWYTRIFQTFGFQDEENPERFVYLAEGKNAEKVFEYRGHYSNSLGEREFKEKFYRKKRG
ncbi:MAG TPA: hypothetical protein P5065_05685 [Candidatus Ratteibacteria bacterium]|nr:hypothetical protein [bacterium]HPC29780.1 hypothetical protein [bacterium]HRS06512.1 hypothetical protein [Candidatus Ratteibacteria bacterium]HRV04613.1 hypothetical protein [Candidatus Ratteibacteria bacterium]